MTPGEIKEIEKEAAEGCVLAKLFIDGLSFLKKVMNAD
jgi:hypothetical protein